MKISKKTKLILSGIAIVLLALALILNVYAFIYALANNNNNFSYGYIVIILMLLVVILFLVSLHIKIIESYKKDLAIIKQLKNDFILSIMKYDAWINTYDLINLVKNKYKVFDIAELKQIVNKDNRLEFNNDKSLIRLIDPDSKDIEEYDMALPPNILYFGVTTNYLDAIKKDGITSDLGGYVILSDNMMDAFLDIKYQGMPTALEIDAEAMINDGYKFYAKANNRYLVKEILPKYILFSKKEETDISN